MVNVSSPNTPNLRQLQDKAALDEILAALQQINTCPVPAPILVKVAPDLSFEALDEILELAMPRQLAGIVATNTTITRPPATDDALRRVYAQPGGLSGRPLRQRSTEVIRHFTVNPGARCRSSASAEFLTRPMPGKKSLPARRCCKFTPA